MEPADIRRSLMERGIELNTGLRLSDITNTHTLSEHVLNIHKCFDGFAAMDQASLIEMWSMNAIRSSGGYIFQGLLDAGNAVIGDYLIGSDFIVANIKDSTRPLTLLYKAKKLSDSYSAFWQDLIDGRLDMS